MNKFVLISISLFIFIIGISCASAASVDANDAVLAGGLGGGGDNGPFYCAHLESEDLGTIPPQYLESIPPQYLGTIPPQYLENADVQDSEGALQEFTYTHHERDPRGVADSAILGGGLGGGGENNFY